MKTAILALFSLAAVTSAAWCEDKKGVDDSAKFEIARRGNHIEQTGTIRSNLIAAAFTQPVDDSDRWHLCLVGLKGEPGFEAMRNLIAKDPAMRPWVNTVDPASSFFKYQVRLLDDATQQNWLKPIESAIKKAGPWCLVLQPPRNGKLGDPADVVKYISGAVDGAALSEKLTDAMKDYLTAAEQASRGGVAQENVGVAPPFHVPPKPDAPAAEVPPAPFEWPPSKPKELSIEQIMEACPGAPARFLIDVMKDKPTSLAMVKLAWMAYQEDHPKQLVPADPPASPLPVNPVEVKPSAPFPLPASNLPTSVLAMIGMSCVVVMGCSFWLLIKAKQIVSRGPYVYDNGSSIVNENISPTPNAWRPSKPSASTIEQLRNGNEPNG